MTTIPRISYKFLDSKKGDAEILIYDDIGQGFYTEGVTAKNFAKELRALGNVDTITIRINSVGGDVFDGNAIYNQLRDHKAHKVVKIDGAALSMASVIAMVGDEIEIAENATFMIHDPWTVAVGDAKDLRKTADVMDTLRDGLASVYVSRTRKTREEITSLMANETWMDAHEAVEMGFADRVGEAKKVAAYMPPNMKVPARFAALFRDHQHKEPVMAATNETVVPMDAINAEWIVNHCPDLVKDWKNEGFTEGHGEGVKEERERMSALSRAFKDRPGFAMDQYIKGNDVARAKAELADVLEIELKAKDKALAEAQAKTTSGAAPIVLDACARIANDQPEDKYSGMDLAQRISAEWEDDVKGCQKKFKNLYAYGAFRQSQEKAKAEKPKAA
jgi:ATP-dependent Clp protease, protease subunit